jgi:hypothetical protein
VFGTDVTVVETDPEKLKALQSGCMPIYEPGLEKRVANNVESRRLCFTDDLSAALKGAEAVFIAVGTPTRRGDGPADLSYVYAAVEQTEVGCSDRLRIAYKFFPLPAQQERFGVQRARLEAKSCSRQVKECVAVIGSPAIWPTSRRPPLAACGSPKGSSGHKRKCNVLHNRRTAYHSGIHRVQGNASDGVVVV